MLFCLKNKTDSYVFRMRLVKVLEILAISQLTVHFDDAKLFPEQIRDGEQKCFKTGLKISKLPYIFLFDMCHFSNLLFLCTA